MAAILKAAEREFEENPGRIDGYRLFTDMSRAKKGVDPRNLNFDIRKLNPGEYCAPYHFHRYAEEMFFVIQGSATLRTPQGVETVGEGDIMFFEMGSGGAHQMYNHTDRPCVYLDVRSFTGFDVAEYPDSNKILLAPTMEIFAKDARAGYFDGEEKAGDKWEQ